ncbi:SDR family oxidoreductase [Pseudooceanicola sp. 216_PA32_1]|uniref:SDR family oxidoreductase n=1 Tax=Pseudooceanicola pacificus TaxID=2676438 RepID=A0A844W5U2_9RHOB|nr:SDR family oxidoreductase [Pseudooceanicola pacificus]MWB79227.1 SDR family oxidoreductase [Pseudooceanicola pacificus]
MTDTVLILGGRSDIGLATAHAFAALGHPVQLAARDAAALEPEKTDLELRHRVAVTLHELDALDVAGHADFVAALEPAPGIVVSVIGALGDQDADEEDHANAIRVMRANYEGPAVLLACVANQMAARGRGTIVGVSSVAGDRGRATNYIYGSAKAGFTAYLSGLRNRLARQGVHVVTVKPGFVATRMTAHMDLPAKLTAQPGQVADAIVAAVTRRRNVVYVKPVWRLVMTIIRAIPEGIFKKLSI